MIKLTIVHNGYIQAKIPKKMEKEVKQLVNEGEFVNISEVTRAAIRMLLIEYNKWPKNDVSCLRVHVKNNEVKNNEK